MTEKDSKIKKLEILQGVQNQISSFDNKASILVSLVGIVFALSLNFLDLFSKFNLEKLSEAEKGKFICVFIIFIAYILSFLVVIISLLFVIIPRTHKKEKINVNYYGDIACMDNKIFQENCEKFYSDNEILFNQIKVNSCICIKKHLFLRNGVFASIVFTILMAALVIISIFI